MRYILSFMLSLGFMAFSFMGNAADIKGDVVFPVISCLDLVDTDLTSIGGVGSVVITAEETTSDGKAVCAITGKLAPEINFQILLPMKSWTGRYLQVGCGGLCGNITLSSGASAGCMVLADGEFVMAATDMGHQSSDETWGLDAQKRADFAYRAQHLTALSAKALITKYYGQEPKYAYFNGCSDGGREALMEAMRYPDDFDGIIAGAPAMLFQVQNTLYHGWMARSNTDENGKIILTSDKLPILYNAVIKACDGNDGLADGIIGQPALCQFDPKVLICEGTDSRNCLTEAQAMVAQKFYEGPKEGDVYLTAGQPVYGSELEWQGVYVTDSADGSLMSEMAVTPVLRYLAFANPRPDMTIKDLEFTTQTLNELQARHPLYDATNADLLAFAQNGGKLIMWHGLADSHIAPANTVSLYNAMGDLLGREIRQNFSRLYLLPAVGHCSGGQGPSNVDLLSAMMDWVEGGIAPDAIITSSTAETSSFGQPDFGENNQNAHRPQKMDLGVLPLPNMTRPVWPYPYIAQYSGDGDYTNAQSWQRGENAEIIKTHDWPGSDMFGKYEFIN